MMSFLNDFLTFNQNAFLSIFYFVYQNIWLILGLVSIGYVFVAEQFLDTENEVRDEREIL
jgi:hypothetical protein